MNSITCDSVGCLDPRRRYKIWAEIARANYDRSDLRYGSDLTDAMWALNCWPPGGEEGFSDFEYTWVPGITTPDFVLNINYIW